MATKRKTWAPAKLACKYFPGREGGPCHIATLYRLVNAGKVRYRKTATGRLLVHTGDLLALWGEPERRQPAEVCAAEAVVSKRIAERLRHHYPGG